MGSRDLPPRSANRHRSTQEHCERAALDRIDRVRRRAAVWCWCGAVASATWRVVGVLQTQTGPPRQQAPPRTWSVGNYGITAIPHISALARWLRPWLLGLYYSPGPTPVEQPATPWLSDPLCATVGVEGVPRHRNAVDSRRSEPPPQEPGARTRHTCVDTLGHRGISTFLDGERAHRHHRGVPLGRAIQTALEVKSLLRRSI